MASQSNLELIDGETVVAALQTEMYAQSTNIIVNVFAKAFAVVAKVLGIKESGQLTITDRRLVIETHHKIFWCFDSGARFSTIMPGTIASVDYAFVGQLLCCCPKYFFYIALTSGQVYSFVLKGGKKQAIDITNAALTTLLKNR